VILAPSYFSSKMTLFLGQSLYPEKQEGLTHLDFCEARSITALMLALKHLPNTTHNNNQ